MGMVNDNRSLIAVLCLSAVGLVGIAVDDGYTAKAVPDPVKGTSAPTISFGTTTGLHMGDTITPIKALERKLPDVRKYEGGMLSHHSMIGRFGWQTSHPILDSLCAYFLSPLTLAVP